MGWFASAWQAAYWTVSQWFGGEGSGTSTYTEAGGAAGEWTGGGEDVFEETAAPTTELLVHDTGLWLWAPENLLVRRRVFYTEAGGAAGRWSAAGQDVLELVSAGGAAGRWSAAGQDVLELVSAGGAAGRIDGVGPDVLESLESGGTDTEMLSSGIDGYRAEDLSIDFYLLCGGDLLWLTPDEELVLTGEDR